MLALNPGQPETNPQQTIELHLNPGQPHTNPTPQPLDGPTIDKWCFFKIKGCFIVLFQGPPGTGKTSLCKALAQKLSIRLSDR